MEKFEQDMQREFHHLIKDLKLQQGQSCKSNFGMSVGQIALSVLFVKQYLVLRDTDDELVSHSSSFCFRR